MTHGNYTKAALAALLTFATLSAGLAAPAGAQLGSTNPAPGPHGVYAITNARIVTVSGAEIAKGTVVVGADGKIQAVGADAAVPQGARVVDATGLTVWPGMMDAGTRMGLAEIEQGANATVDNAETGSLNPNAQAIYGLNPHSAHIGVTRVGGVTHVVSSPTGGLVSGQSAIVNLAGWTVPEMTVVPRTALVINLPSSGFGGRGGFGAFLAQQQGGNAQDQSRTRERQLDSIRTLFRDAEAYRAAHAAFEKDKSLPRPRHDVILASLDKVVSGGEPVIFTANRANEIRQAVEFAKEMKVKAIIVGGRDAWMVTDLLKQNDVPVILTEVRALPTREDDPYDVNYTAPAKLAAAGVRFAIASGDDGPHVRDLPHVAGMAVAYGLPKDVALKSVTLAPAQIFGVADRLGSIEVGKVANLVVTDGDLFEPRTRTKYLYIDGRPIPLGNRHEDLYNQFKDRIK